MLQIQNLKKSFGGEALFEGVNLQMTRGERLGLVGRNGHGKSTLFKIILGAEEHDSGQIVFPKNYKIGHLEQHLKFTQPTILEEGCLGLPADEADDHYKVEAILFGLGFTKDDMDRAPAQFSGGFQIRLNLAKVLVAGPNLLLLDEPTNYLDILSVRWLTQFLKSWKDEMIIISHDREFMDSVTTHTAAIHRKKLKKIPGTTEKLYAQILEEEEIHEKTRVNEQKKREKMEVYINRFRAKASKAAGVQSKIKMMNKLPALNKLDEIESLDFEFRYAPTPAKTVMSAKGLTFGFDGHKPLFENLEFTVGCQERIAIIGKNGKGKSTLLNLLAGEFKPARGTIHKHDATRIGYFGQTNVARLNPKNTIEKEISESNTDLARTVVRNICGTMMFSGDTAEKPISILSGGEKSRVLLGKILAHPSNLLFLDEPTNHLDMESIDSLVESIRDYPGAVLIVTHSERILRETATKLIVFQSDKVDVFNGDYDDFLAKIGWEEEIVRPKKKAAPDAVSENPQKDAGKIRKRLEKQMKTLEEEIVALETKFAAENEALSQVSQNCDLDKIHALSDAVVETQRQIDEKFEALSKIEKEFQKLA